MSAFLNLGLFVAVLYLIFLYARWPDLKRHPAASMNEHGEEKRIA